MRRPLKKLDKKHLRRWLLLFFFALLVPTVLLVQQSYSRLKWETFHQHQLMAAELSERIDQQLLQLINHEDQRAFNDFSFLKTDASTQSSVPQRSPLSEFPVRELPAGLLGYFQVDATGQLITPVVPTGSSESYGIPATELNQRIALQNKIQDILASNQLVQKPPPPPPAPAREAKAAAALSSFSVGRSSGASYESTAGNDAEEEAVSSVSSELAAEVSDADYLDDAAANQRNEAKISAPQALQQQAPMAFDQLKEVSRQAAQKSDYGRVEDLKLQQNYIQKDSDKKPQPTARTQAQARLKKAEITGSAEKADSATQRIRTFESEIDAFEFSRLDDTYFVLFRKVWRNGQRYTQGLLIEQTAFLEEAINRSFAQTTLSEMSDLRVAYQGNVLKVFSGREPENNRNISHKMSNQSLGEQLYQVRLSDPLSDLQLIYSITQLPIGSGGRLILWLASLSGLVLLGSFYLIYRLGLSQINLINQQQDFVSAVSHELKTPLTSIRMYGEMLIQGWATEEKKKTYYQFIFDESERLSRLINNVLQLARMTRNEQKAELTVRNVPELVQEITAKITSQIEASDFTLVVNADDQLSTAQLMIDSDWLIQIMINLVDNAIKFSSKAEQKIITLEVRYSGQQQVSFTINDCGPGIDKQHMKKVFELFYRSENELTRDTVGTGIGLSLVHQMTVAMGGKVKVENRGLAGAFPGAAFSVVFPLSE